MNVKIKPSRISGNIKAPPSKSYMQRACAAALIKGGITIIKNPGKSEDDLHAASIIQQMGCKISKVHNDEWQIESNGLNADTKLPEVIYFGESGLSLRMFTPLIAVSSSRVHIEGKGSILKRKNLVFNDVFVSLGVDFHSHMGLLPFSIQGPMQPVHIRMDGSKGSQYLTGVLMAYSAIGAAGKVIEVSSLKSTPYIDLTLSVLSKFNLPVPENLNYERFVFPSLRKTSIQPVTYHVEGDWSGASFWLVGAAVSGKITLSCLDPYSLQSDKNILMALEAAGCSGSVFKDQIEIEESPLKPFYFDATDCPDLFPPLAVLAAHCAGVSTIKGLNRLKDKESDRGVTLQTEFEKMEAVIELDYNNNEMKITGGKKLKGGIFDPHDDHRIAMACAIAALNAEGESTIINAEAVNKSYPDFWNDLRKAGAQIEIE